MAKKSSPNSSPGSVKVVSISSAKAPTELEASGDLERWNKKLASGLRLLKVIEAKKYKRLAKGVEKFLEGSIENPGTILALMAGSVQIKPRSGSTGRVRGQLLEMWEEWGYITKKEIEQRED